MMKPLDNTLHMKPDEWKIFAYGMENDNMHYIFLKLFVGNSNKLALVKIL